MILEGKRKVVEKEPEPGTSKTKSKCKKFPLEMREEFIHEIKNDEKKYKWANI